MTNKNDGIIKAIIIALSLITVVTLIIGLAVMLTWNIVMPSAGLHKINLLQGVCLYWLVNILTYKTHNKPKLLNNVLNNSISTKEIVLDSKMINLKEILK